MFLLLLACPKHTDLEPPVPDARPIVPAPVAPIYTRSPGAPADPLVRWAMPQADESLSGAAAALAFVHDEHGAVDEAAVRWALIRAGWPYGYAKVDLTTVEPDAVPQALVATSQELPEGTSAGLARVRGEDGDTWVLVVGAISQELPAFPRESDIGEQLDLGTSQRSLAPSGRIHEGPVVFGEPGEWLVEVGEVRVPVYVGEPTPEDGPFLSVETGRPSEAEAVASTTDRLNVLRDLLGTTDVEVDPVLNVVAGDEAERRAGGAVGDGREEAIRGAGYDGAVGELVCTGQTVQGCLDNLFWSIDARQHLGEETYTHAGIGARWTASGLVIVVDLAG